MGENSTGFNTDLHRRHNKKKRPLQFSNRCVCGKDWVRQWPGDCGREQVQKRLSGNWAVNAPEIQAMLILMY